MCLICIEYNKNRLTLKEAWTNLGEMYHSLESDHRKKVIDKLMDEALYGDEELDDELWKLIFRQFA